MKNASILLMILVVAGAAWLAFGRHLMGTATYYDAVSGQARETVFPQPRIVDWQGDVIAHLAGGQGIAIHRVGAGSPEFFQAYSLTDQTLWEFEGSVIVHGSWTGIDCAYKRTIFGGRCTPTVDIERIVPVASQ